MGIFSCAKNPEKTPEKDPGKNRNRFERKRIKNKDVVIE